MFKYRKKPVEIEAFQLAEDDGTLTLAYPQWFLKAIRQGEIVPQPNSSCVVIPTLEGAMTASEGDWIIRGVKGELYPCKDEIFQLTYDKVED